MGENTRYCFGSGDRAWDPVEHIPQSIIEEYADQTVCDEQLSHDVCGLGATEVWDVGITGNLCQVYCNDVRGIFVFYRKFIQATQYHLIPDLDLNVGAKRICQIFRII